MIVLDSNENEIFEFNKPYRSTNKQSALSFSFFISFFFRGCFPTLFPICQKEMTVTKINESKRNTIGYIQEPIFGG